MEAEVVVEFFSTANSGVCSVRDSHGGFCSRSMLVLWSSMIGSRHSLHNAYKEKGYCKIKTKSSKGQACHKSCRQTKKMNTSAETKVTELITSSARKHKNVEVRPRKIRDTQGSMNLDDWYDLPQDETEDICMTIKSSFSHEASEERSAPSVPETIFSRGFHFPKDVCGDIMGKRDFTVVFSKDQSVCGEHIVEDMQIDAFNFCRTIESQLNSVDNGTEVTSYVFFEKTDSFSGNTNTSSSGEYSVLENISPEVSEIYLAMQHSKLECIDEPSHESVSTDGCDMDAEDDFDAFDPYQFIKNLPDLSAVIPTFRPTLLPRQTRNCPSTTLVLVLDETLVHSMLEPCNDTDFTFPVDYNFTTHTVYVRCRPYLKDFLERVSSLFEIIIFTASQGIYAEQLLNVLDPKRRLFSHRSHLVGYSSVGLRTLVLATRELNDAEFEEWSDGSGIMSSVSMGNDIFSVQAREGYIASKGTLQCGIFHETLK